MRIDRSSGHLKVARDQSTLIVDTGGGETFIACLDDIRQASATGLRNALRGDEEFDEQHLTISDVPAEEFDSDYSPVEPISFVSEHGELRVAIEVAMESDGVDAESLAKLIEHTTSPLLRRQAARFVEARSENYPTFRVWHVLFAPRLRGRTLGELYDDASQILALLLAMDGGGLQRETVLELLRAGRPETLIGQPEGDWLDVKRQDYDLDNDGGKISLAQDVARFANAEYGGIVLVGMEAKKTGSGEVIRAVRPLARNVHGVRRHRQAIDTRVFPAPDGLTVEQIAVESGAIVIVHVPPQPEELKPFLVHGAIVGGKIEGGFISIVRRRGEESIPITAAAIHGTLATGRALMRRGVLPTEGDSRRQTPKGQ